MDWESFSKRVYEKSKQSETPFHACFELTPLCNFSCNMCFIRLDPAQARLQGKLLTTAQWLKIAAEAKKMGTVTLELTGGEAITRSDFKELYLAFIKMGFLIHLRTNGYGLDEKLLELLTEFKPRKISVTLYGSSDEMYKKMCAVPDGFTIVTKNILKMKAAGLNIHLTMTVTKDNVIDLEPLKEWATKNDLSITPYGALITPIRGAKRSIEHLRIEYPENEFEIPEELERTSHYEVSDRDSLENPFWLCRGFGAKFCISWDGRITICNTFTNVWEDALTNGLNKAYHDLYTDLRKLKRPAECHDCKYIEFCAACPSQLQSATGDSEHTCDNICKYARRKYRYYLQRNAEKSIKTEGIVGEQCRNGDTEI